MAEKNLPRQINYLQSPVIIRNFDHSKTERKKLTLKKLQNMESGLVAKLAQTMGNAEKREFFTEIASQDLKHEQFK